MDGKALGLMMRLPLGSHLHLGGIEENFQSFQPLIQNINLLSLTVKSFMTALMLKMAQLRNCLMEGIVFV